MLRSFYASFSEALEKYLVLLVIIGFVGGIYGASVSPAFIESVNNGIDTFMNWYDFVAPIAIFLILAPSLTKMLVSGEGEFGAHVIKLYAIRKIFASVWAVVFIAALLRLPILPENTTSMGGAISQTLKSLGIMATTSPYFYAMYLSFFAAFMAKRVHWLFRLLNAGLALIEEMGKFFLPIIPVFMVAIGAYIYGLPEAVSEQVGLESGVTLTALNIWGWTIDPSSGTGMLWIYIVGALITAVACFLWHGVLLFITARAEPRFKIKGYFRNYWIKVYPLLWATSSEALATPLNLYLTKRHAPWVRDNIRRFCIGIGSYMNINGTLINVFILGAIVLSILGYPISVIELLLIIPIVFLISYGVPGIPGELVLFAGPMATLLNLPPDILPLFLAIYIGLQIGLPDSFRTGNNSTDDFVSTIWMNAIYSKKFADSDEKQADEIAQQEIEALPEAV